MPSIFESIDALSKEKGIDPQIVRSAVMDAMLVAARKQFKTNEDLAADLDEKSNQILIYAVKKVVETVEDPLNQLTVDQAQEFRPGAEVGDEIRIPKGTESLGRISAQTAKQVILQKVREAERETIYGEYADRVGELVNCTVKRIEGVDLVCDLGKTESRLPKKEQSRLENFTVGDRVRCVIRSVEKTGKNAGVIVSRGAPELVMRLFEGEVPEIYDGTVVIKGCAREAGERTKIAVFSRDRDVDCVGACVGMKGMRVQSIIRELRGEKIDIIEYSDDPVVYATHALSPAKISRVTVLSSADRHMEVIVDDTQLSLAIGKKGQNVRLAAKLLGWKIDIKSEEEKRQEVDAQMAALSSGTPVSILIESGMPEYLVETLVAGGVGTVERLAEMTPEEIEAIPGISEEMILGIRDAVLNYYGQYENAPAPAEEEPAAVDLGAVDPEAEGPAQDIVASKDDPDAYPAWSGQAEAEPQPTYDDHIWAAATRGMQAGSPVGLGTEPRPDVVNEPEKGYSPDAAEETEPAGDEPSAPEAPPAVTPDTDAEMPEETADERKRDEE